MAASGPRGFGSGGGGGGGGGATSSPFECRDCGGVASCRKIDGVATIECASPRCGARHPFRSGPSAPTVTARAPAAAAAAESSGPTSCPKCQCTELSQRVSGPGSKRPNTPYRICTQCNAFCGFLDAAANPSSGGGGRAAAAAAAAGATSSPRGDSGGGGGGGGDSDGAPMCRCSEPQRARLSQSKSEKNPGRWFYGCPAPRGSGCNFFAWAPDEVGAAQQQQQPASAPTMQRSMQPPQQQQQRVSAGDTSSLCKCGRRAESFLTRPKREGERGIVGFRCAQRSCDYISFSNQLDSTEAPAVRKMRDLLAKVITNRVQSDFTQSDDALNAPIQESDIAQLIHVTEDAVRLVETFQQGSVDWLLMRWLRIGGTTIGLGMNPHKSPEDVVRDTVFGQRDFSNDAMRFGSVMEEPVRRAFEMWLVWRLYEPFAAHYGMEASSMMHTRMMGTPRTEAGSFHSMLARIDAAPASAPASASASSPAAAAGADEDAQPQKRSRSRAASEPVFHPPNVKMTTPGLKLRADLPHLGASPDGVVLYKDPATGKMCRGVVEIKTRMDPAASTTYSDQDLNAWRGKPFAPKFNVPNLHGVPAWYLAQLVLNMYMQGAEVGYFVVSNCNVMTVTEVRWTREIQAFWSNMYQAATNFYTKAIIPAAVDALNGVIRDTDSLMSYVMRGYGRGDAVVQDSLA